MTRTCSDCSTTIGRTNKGGRCKTCTLAHACSDPEIQALRLDRLRAVQATDEHRNKISRGKKAWAAQHADDPIWTEKSREHGRRLRARFEATPGAEDKRKAALTAAMRVRADRMLGWCPVDRRAEYRRLRKLRGAPEAKRLILSDMATAEAKRLAALTPLQRQIERIQAGARLIEKPVYRRAEPEFSLVGCGTGMF